jgi:hypothetical protein
MSLSSINKGVLLFLFIIFSCVMLSFSCFAIERAINLNSIRIEIINACGHEVDVEAGYYTTDPFPAWSNDEIYCRQTSSSSPFRCEC